MKPSSVIAVHGIHDNGDDGIDRLGAMLASGLNVPFYAPDLPRRWAVTDYLPYVLEHDAAIVRPRLNRHTVVLTHSRGAQVLHRAMQPSADHGPHHLIHTAFLFAPALEPDILLGDGGFHRCYVVFNEHDRALKWSRFLPLHPYADFLGGSMGRDGYQGEDERVINVPDHERRSFLSHSEFWGDDYTRQRWVAFMVRKLEGDG